MKQPTRHLLFYVAAVVLVLTAVPALHAQEDDPAPPQSLPQQQQEEGPQLVPDRVPLSSTVRSAVDDELLTEEERDRLRLFHGLFEELSDEAKGGAAHALATFDLNAPALSAEDAPVMIRAEAAYLRGDLEDAIELLGDEDGPPAVLLRGRALAGMGRYEEAIEILTPLRDRARRDDFDDAGDLTAAAEAVAELALLEGRPAQDYQFVMNLLGEAQQQIDRLHWPALIAQGRLLLEKDNPQQAVETLHQALRLNPKSSEAWRLLGQAALGGYDFDSAEAAIEKLRNIHPEHVLADLLEIEMYLTQKDPRFAEEILDAALDRYPEHRRLLACRPAVAALKYDSEQTQAALDRFEEVAGDNPLALYLTGKYLSMGRQYADGEEMLRAAIDRQPNWPKPQVELGLLLNQFGKEGQALDVLRRVSRLDPFNKRAANTLKLLEELADYQQIETEHFIIKYRDDIDGALAADMPPVLERIFDEVTAAFSHRPERKTLIEIMPDKRWFAVRITGMPWIWTIGAATGPVLAITPPREGAYQSGVFDWQRVLRHEFAHTVTLDKTANRIPHWFTEACAVAQEPEPRDYRTAQQLAQALAEDELFDLEEINWAFVRPKKPTDRGLAYAQSHWMYEYITERFGHGTILEILDLCREGVPQSEVVPRATGQSAERFLAEFEEWAGEQVESWGLAPTPSSEELAEEIGDVSGSDAAGKLRELLDTYPNHPDLLRIAAAGALENEEDEAARVLLLRYADARPIDPWADRKLAELALRLDRPEDAVSPLERLDRFDQRSGTHAETLTEIYRRLDRLDDAQRAAHHALARRPYDPKLRETAATIALQRNQTDPALVHLQALTLIEPDRAIHFTRLAALYHRLDRPEDAHAAAVRARELDSDAPVEPFIKAGEDDADR